MGFASQFRADSLTSCALLEKSDLSIAKSERAHKARRGHRDAPIVEGTLKKQAKSMFGFGPSIWHDRWFLLDPVRGVLEYWEPSQKDVDAQYDKPSGPPKHQFLLKSLVKLEWNRLQPKGARYRRHFVMQVIFGNAATKEVESILHLQAANESEFQRWLDALQPCGLRRGVDIPFAKCNTV